MNENVGLDGHIYDGKSERSSHITEIKLMRHEMLEKEISDIAESYSVPTHGAT